ncbi:hypothetical protein DM860_016604 [Cuscuta australis]|uniref:Uncharacterized protein n=1 Tax=Cuscuta australis TaxID=267555 RepID=A0A328DNY3_9ASTE|nr:hypothetical protein DM860_016604 [Cuscuta australis]
MGLFCRFHPAAHRYRCQPNTVAWSNSLMPGGRNHSPNLTVMNRRSPEKSVSGMEVIPPPLEADGTAGTDGGTCRLSLPEKNRWSSLEQWGTPGFEGLLFPRRIRRRRCPIHHRESPSLLWVVSTVVIPPSLSESLELQGCHLHSLPELGSPEKEGAEQNGVGTLPWAIVTGKSQGRRGSGSPSLSFVREEEMGRGARLIEEEEAKKEIAA